MLDLARDHIQLFGLPVRFDLDRELLTQRYRELQRVAHPDRHAGASQREQLLAVQGASQINDAFRTLKEPLARAIYLLELRGLPLDGGSQAPLDPLFLMEQMEQREQLAAARLGPEPDAQARAVLAATQGREQALIAELAQRLDGDDGPALSGARDLVRQLQFLAKLRQQAEDLVADLEEARHA